MEIPAGGDDGVRTKIVQAMGSLLFKVEKRANQHFEVETPYLAAVVKGTTFTVSVDGETSAVHVVEGAVEVTALATGQVGLVKPGYTAVVSQRKGKGLSIIGGKAEGSGKGGQRPQAKELESDIEDPDQAAGRAAAPGQVKRLNAMLGQASVDVATTSKGFVRNASCQPTARGASGKGSANGKSVAKASARTSPAPATPAGPSRSASPRPARPSATRSPRPTRRPRRGSPLSPRPQEKALKDKLKVGGGGDNDDDDDDDD